MYFGGPFPFFSGLSFFSYRNNTACLLFTPKLLHRISDEATEREKKSNKIYRQFQSNILLYLITSSAADRYPVIYCVIASKPVFYNWKSFCHPPRGNEHLQNVVSQFMVWNEFVSYLFLFSTCCALCTVDDIVIHGNIGITSVTKNSNKKTCKQPIDKH